jgi:hypothetical protein
MSATKFIKASLIFFCLLSAGVVKAQLQDTTIYYFKQIGDGSILVSSVDSADYFRIIPAFRKSDKLVEVKDYYRDGKVRLVGQIKPQSFNSYNGSGSFKGMCIIYYPSGIRKNITTYNDYGKDGFEYQYYPDGKLYKLVNNKADVKGALLIGELVECYDVTGEQVCKDGSGISIDYDNNLKDIVMTGPIVNGKKGGIWKGKIDYRPLAKFDFIYKEGKFISGIGHDSIGKAYPFDEVFVQASYVNGPIEYVYKIRDELKSYKFSKAIVDSVKVTFIVEEDGSLDNVSAVNVESTELLQALKKSIEKLGRWSPTTNYGIPLKAKVFLSLKITSEKSRNIFKKVEYSLRPLYNGEELKVNRLITNK